MPTGADAAPAVRLAGVTTIVDGVAVLNGCSLDLDAGAVLVLMGPSGAGKSTLVRHLAGLLAPTRGSVEIGGADVGAAGERELRVLRRRMSVLLGGSSVFDGSLFASLTALENVAYGLDTRGVPAHRCADVAMSRLVELGLGDRATDLPAALPAHARKRLALARALVVDAPLLVIDELETGLDSVHRARVLAALRAQHERTGCTLVVTTHDVSLARELGGTVAVLGGGRVVAHGPAARLLEGVETGAEVEQRFAALVGVVRDPLPVDEPRTFSIDERVLWTGLAALILVAVLAALYTHLPLP